VADKVEVKKFNIGPATREKIDALVRAAAMPDAVTAKLDCRYTSKQGVYTAYERWLCDPSGHSRWSKTPRSGPQRNAE
jgi:hypothetical protein